MEKSEPPAAGGSAGWAGALGKVWWLRQRLSTVTVMQGRATPRRNEHPGEMSTHGYTRMWAHVYSSIIHRRQKVD